MVILVVAESRLSQKMMSSKLVYSHYIYFFHWFVKTKNSYFYLIQKYIYCIIFQDVILYICHTIWNECHPWTIAAKL